MLSHRRSAARTVLLATLTLILGLAALPLVARAQDEAPVVQQDTTLTAPSERFPNNIAGEFTPSKGFDIIKTQRGSLNISAYGLFRYLNQMPGEQTFTDHLGRERTVKARNDLNWHRSFVWLSGFMGVPQLRYTVSIWSLPTTQQTLVFGSLMYTVDKPLTVGVGIGPNLSCRSTQGSWPYWAGTDRQMAEDFFRGGFSSGVFVMGEPVSRLFYRASVNTNLSQLGTTAANDTRDMSYSVSGAWMPTTGEFGARGGLPDLEGHHTVATRFGFSACTSRESRYASLGSPPNASQIKLSDGLNPFDADALADGVTVQTLDYGVATFDAGFKYRGFSFQGEGYVRKLSNFKATGPLPLGSITDRGFMLEAMHMVVPQTLGLYAAGGYIFDDFERNPWEIAGGASLYPFKSYVWRLNLHVIHIEKCPASSNFGYYSSGQTGTTLSLATDFLF
jgi:hypothetical protein